MKNLKRILTIMLLLLTMSSSFAVFASEEFILKREMTFTNENNREVQAGGFVEIMIGQKNLVTYQKDGDITITPAPDELREDDFGNLIAYYDVSGYKPGRTLNVIVQRKVDTGIFEKEISVRSESSVTTENQLYVEAQTRIDSEEKEMIAKANELTEGLSSDYKKARAIFDYVNTEMEYVVASTYANQGSLSALKTNKGVCEEFATLFAALCRSIDIPCKVIEGYSYEKKVISESEIIFDTTVGNYVASEPVYEYSLTNHVWNEIWLDDYGWVPVDTCVLFAPQGERLPYRNSFCAIKEAEYIATGIYNYDRANRRAQGMMEVSYKEQLYEVEDVVVVEHSFSDIGNYTWAEESINSLYDMGIIKGYTDSEYGPGGNISRIEFIVLLARILESMNYQPPTDGMIYYFMDYDKNHYSKAEYDYLMTCLEAEVSFDRFASGYYAMSTIFGSSLNMNQPITRGEVVALLDPFLKYDNDGENIFTDIQNHKFKSSVLKAYSNGLIKGYEDGTFRPNGTITRAEIAVVLDRYIGVKDYVI